MMIPDTPPTLASFSSLRLRYFALQFLCAVWIAVIVGITASFFGAEAEHGAMLALWIVFFAIAVFTIAMLRRVAKQMSVAAPPVSWPSRLRDVAIRLLVAVPVATGVVFLMEHPVSVRQAIVKGSIMGIFYALFILAPFRTGRARS